MFSRTQLSIILVFFWSVWFRFSERGKIFAKQEVRAIQIGPSGLFFTGDGSGQVKVWQWLAEQAATTR